MALIFKNESYTINGVAMEVYNHLGQGFLEAVYQEALEKEFISRGIPYEREKELTISYKGNILKQRYKVLCMLWQDNCRVESRVITR